jgi:hypothetical protein
LDLISFFAFVNADALGGVCSTHGAKKNACRVLVGKSEGKTH